MQENYVVSEMPKDFVFIKLRKFVLSVILAVFSLSFATNMFCADLKTIDDAILETSDNPGRLKELFSEAKNRKLFLLDYAHFVGTMRSVVKKNYRKMLEVLLSYDDIGARFCWFDFTNSGVACMVCSDAIRSNNLTILDVLFKSKIVFKNSTIKDLYLGWLAGRLAGQDLCEAAGSGHQEVIQYLVETVLYEKEQLENALKRAKTDTIVDILEDGLAEVQSIIDEQRELDVQGVREGSSAFIKGS